MTYEYYSSLALVSSVVVYALAMFAHTAEWAAARRLGVAKLAAPELVDVAAVERGDRQLHPEPSKMRSESSLMRPEPAQIGPEPSQMRPEPSQSQMRPEPVEGRDPPNSTSVPDSEADAAVSRRVEQFGRMGVALTVIGFLLSVFGVLARALAAQRAPWGNMFEFTITALVFVVGVYLILVWRAGLHWLGLPVTMLAAVGNGLAVTVFYVAVAPLVPALHSVWFLIHIVAAAISGAAFNVGGLMSILYLIKKRAEERGNIRGYLGRVPDSRKIDLIAYRFNAFAFPLWTFTVVAGAIWAEYAWGRYWGWDPKETWALVTWVIYACYLHARSTAGWRGTRAAVISIIGLASFWFNFVGINLLVSGLHSYAGI
jgi:cytochrome c-type biogenesis protein CcsB